MAHICATFQRSFITVYILSRIWSHIASSGVWESSARPVESMLCNHPQSLGCRGTTSISKVYCSMSSFQHFLYRSFFDRQSSTLTVWMDRLLAVLYQPGRPVAQKMHTGLFYKRTLVLENETLNKVVLI